MSKTKIFSKKITSLVCSASLFASPVGLQNKKISAANDRHSLYSHDLEKAEGITEALLQKLESHTDSKVEEVKKQNLINQFLSETKGLFPKDKDQEIKLMLNNLSSDQLKLVRNLDFKKPRKAFLEELLLAFYGISDFINGRYGWGVFNLFVMPNIASIAWDGYMKIIKNQEITEKGKLLELALISGILTFDAVISLRRLINAKDNARIGNYNKLTKALSEVFD